MAFIGRLKRGFTVFIITILVLSLVMSVTCVTADGAAKNYYLWPSKTKMITSKYGWRTHPVEGKRKLHTGVDIGAPSGSIVRAAAKGTVKYADRLSRYGNCVIIKHANGIKTLYAHNAILMVEEGETVKQGQTIALCGDSGMATGPHIHFEVHVNGHAVNPQKHVSPDNQKINASSKQKLQPKEFVELSKWIASTPGKHLWFRSRP